VVLGITEINHDRLDMTYPQLLSSSSELELTDMQIPIGLRWESRINHPSWKILVETAGVDDVEEDASAALGVGSFLGLAASAFCFASSRVPNISVKTVSRDSLISDTLAHLGC
jgi:hypothetical protein